MKDIIHTENVSIDGRLILIDVTETGMEGTDCYHLAEDRDK